MISNRNEITRHLQLMRQQAEKNRNELSVLYNQMRETLMERE